MMGPCTRQTGAQKWRWQEGKKHGHAQAAPSFGRPDVVKDNTKSVYVKNLPFQATEDDLIAFFSQAGKVVDVRRGLNEEGKDQLHLLLSVPCLIMLPLCQAKWALEVTNRALHSVSHRPTSPPQVFKCMLALL